MTPPASPYKGIAIGFLAYLLFSCGDAAAKALGGKLPVTEIGFFSTLFAAAILLLLTPRDESWRDAWRPRHPKLVLLRGIAGATSGILAIYAFVTLPFAEAYALIFLSPSIATILSIFLLGEQVGWRRWLAVAFGFGGVLLIVRPGFAIFDARLLLPLLGALLFAIYQILLRLVARYDSPPTTLLYSAFVGAGALSLVGPFDFVAPDAAGWGLLLLSACLGAGAHFALIRAFDYAPASRLQPYGYTMMLWAAVFGVVVFGQFPDAWTVLGAVLICAGGLYAYYRERAEAG